MSALDVTIWSSLPMPALLIDGENRIIDINPAAWCAVELAFLDLFGRAADRPVEALLGLAERQDPAAIDEACRILGVPPERDGLMGPIAALARLQPLAVPVAGQQRLAGEQGAERGVVLVPFAVAHAEKHHHAHDGP